MSESLQELKARQAEVAREWEWLQELLYKVAKMRADQQDTRMFQMLQHQALIVGERRVALSDMIAHHSRTTGSLHGQA